MNRYATKTDGPPCAVLSVVGRCKGGCNRPLHSIRSCADGHPRHASRGLCSACRLRHKRAGTLDQFHTARTEAITLRLANTEPLDDDRRDEVLAEWELTGQRDYPGFHKRVGLTAAEWDDVFRTAETAGDRRAVKR